MARYSEERKESVLKKLLPPHNMTVAELSRREHISVQTLYNWRDTAKKMGMPVPGKKTTTEDWSAEAKLAVIIETATLSASELSIARQLPWPVVWVFMMNRNTHGHHLDVEEE